jgi:uncharacterized protein YggE
VPARAQEPAPSTPIVVTTGEADVRRAPDRAVITVAVEARADRPAAAQQQAAAAAAAVLKRLESAGIPKDAVRTSGYDLQQEFNTPNGRRVPAGFVARHTIEVTVDQVARTGEIVDTAVQGGATSVDGLRFELRDRDAAEREAIKLAVADARRRAEAAAAGAGGSLGRILKIESFKEAQPFSPRPMFAGAAEMKVTTPIVPGEIDVHARVTLTVELK